MRASGIAGVLAEARRIAAESDGAPARPQTPAGASGRPTGRAAIDAKLLVAASDVGPSPWTSGSSSSAVDVLQAAASRPSSGSVVWRPTSSSSVSISDGGSRTPTLEGGEAATVPSRPSSGSSLPSRLHTSSASNASTRPVTASATSSASNARSRRPSSAAAVVTSNALIDTTCAAADTATHSLTTVVASLAALTSLPVAGDGVVQLGVVLGNVEGSLHAAEGAAVHVRKMRGRLEESQRDAPEDALMKLLECSERVAACKDACAVALLTCLQSLTRTLAAADTDSAQDGMQRCILQCCAIMLRLHALPAPSSRADAAALAAARTLFALSKHEEMDALIRACGCLTAAVAFIAGLQDVPRPPLPPLTPTLVPLLRAPDAAHAMVMTSCISTSCLMRSMETLTFLTGALKHATASEAAAVWLVTQGAVGPLTHLLVACAADATSISTRLDAIDGHARRGGGSASTSPAAAGSPEDDAMMDARLSVQGDLLSAEKALMQVCAQVTAIVRNLSVSKKCLAPLWASHVVHALLALLQPARTCKYTEVVLNIGRGLAKLSAQPEARSVMATSTPIFALALSTQHFRRTSSAAGASVFAGDRRLSSTTSFIDDNGGDSIVPAPLPPAPAATRGQSAGSVNSTVDGDGVPWAAAALQTLAAPARSAAACLLSVLQSKRGHADLVIRITYALANTATTEEAFRTAIARETKGLSTLASVLKFYVTLLLPHTHTSLSSVADTVRSSSAADSSPSGAAAATAAAVSPMDAMDVVAKCARVIANLALTASVGASLTGVKSMDAIGHALLWACNLAEDDAASSLPVAVTTLLHDMLPCLISAVTNLAFYMDAAKLADVVRACSLALTVPDARTHTHLVELPAAPGVQRMPAATTFASIANSAGVMGGDFSRACVLITVLMVRVVGAVALTGMRWNMAEVQRLTARVPSNTSASAAAALEVNDAVLLECLRALGNLLRCSPLRALLAPSTEDLTRPMPSTHVGACISLIPAALCYCIASGGVEDVRYTATGVLLNLASDPTWKPTLAHGDAFTPLLHTLSSEHASPTHAQASAVAHASATATAHALCGGSTAIACLTHVLHSSYYDADDISLSLVLLQCMVNYALGWEVDAAARSPPRFTSDECVSLMQSCSGIMEDAEGDEDVEDDALGADPLYTAALRLYTILRSMVEQDAVRE